MLTGNAIFQGKRDKPGGREMSNPVDQIFFNDLAGLDPHEVSKRANCIYDSETECYTFEVWKDEYTICPNQSKIYRSDPFSVTSHDSFSIFVIHYLLGTKPIEIRHQWVSEKDLPSGAAFFRGPHELPTHLITDHFQNQIEAFHTVCKNLGGKLLDMADAAYTFDITPRVPVAVLYWEGDDEFPAEAKLLFDPTISDHMALDAIYALGLEVCTRISQAYNAK
jgi:hypothetical protein